jgi:DNA helicase-2/ATP-dependent DNA helicase PcrA
LSEAVQWQLAMRIATRARGPFQHLDWGTPYVAGLIVALAGDLADHLATAEQVRRHDQKVRDEVEALPKQLKGALDIVAKTHSRDELLGLVAAYNAEKARLDVLDFGDQVALACEIAQAAPEVVSLERSRFRLVVLDEYQDTGVAQRVLLSRLFGVGRAVNAVGDPNQSIYGWRGASTSNLARYTDHFTSPEPPDTLHLTTSFRCDGRILDAANKVAKELANSAAAGRRAHIEIPDLKARPGAEDAGEVTVSRHETAAEEAEALAVRIEELLKTDPTVTPGGIAVLARRRLDFARLHHAMTAREIPVEVVGLGGLLAMPEVSDIVAVLSLLADSTANAAAVRLLSGPRWRLGIRDLAALGTRADHLAKLRIEGETDEDTEAAANPDDGADEPAVGGSEGLDHALEEATTSVDPVEVPSLLEAAESPGKASRCSAEALARLAAFAAEIHRLRALVGQPLVDLITEVISTTGLDVEIEAGDPKLAIARIANVQAFLDTAAHFTGLDGEADLISFLAYLRAAADNEDGLDVAAVSDADTVKLMTVHAAKGLEWDVVAVPGLVDKVFPSDRGRSPWTTGAQVLPFDCRGDSLDLPVLGGYTTNDFKAFKEDCKADAQDEERRLAYVAMTRAKHRLWLSAYVWSATRKEPMSPSPYLLEAKEIGAPSVVTTNWCDDPEPDAVNPTLEAGVADVAWPALPDQSEMHRRRAIAERVERARATTADEQLTLVIGDSAGGGAPVSSWRRDAELLLDEARRRRIRTIDVAVPARLTTSQIVALAQDEDAFAASIARPLPSRPQPAARRGSRFHEWVEGLYSMSPLIEPDELYGAEDDDLSDEELAALQATFLAGGWGERQPVQVEAPFEMMLGSRMVRGRIDAVYPREDGGYDVIDFKTGAVLAGRAFEVAALQLATYRLAWADLAGVSPDQVSAGFLYVRTGELKRPDRLLDRDELTALLEGALPVG